MTDDKTSTAQLCVACGNPIFDKLASPNRLCENCLARQGSNVNAALMEKFNQSAKQIPAEKTYSNENSFTQQNPNQPWNANGNQQINPHHPDSLNSANQPNWNMNPNQPVRRNEGIEIIGGAYQPAQGIAGPQSPVEPLAVDTSPNPDNPRWGILSGFGVWLASIIVLFLASAIGAGIYLVFYKSRGNVIPLEAEALNKVLMSEGSILIQMAMNIGAHLATIAICWAVVTRLGKHSFAEGIGWRWEGQTPIAKIAIIVGVSLLFIVVVGNLPRLIPDSKTNPFAEMLKVSQSVRYAVAFLAVFTAPLTEELVYRGLIYSPLKRAIGTVGAIATATLLFAMVHVPQYLGAWGSLTGLLLLSLALTCIRAKTKSIFPCVWIHTLFNAAGAIFIVLGKE